MVSSHYSESTFLAFARQGKVVPRDAVDSLGRAMGHKEIESFSDAFEG